MTTYERLKEAMENQWPVVAEVQLYSGEVRVRIGPVANLDRNTVTIWDAGKGYRENPNVNTLSFRSTPLTMIRHLKVHKPKVSRGSWWKDLLFGYVEAGA